MIVSMPVEAHNVQTLEVRIWEPKSDPTRCSKVGEHVVLVMTGLCPLSLGGSSACGGIAEL